MQQNLGEDPTGSFIIALLEQKLDKNTMFEWQKASQEATPHYEDLFKFLDLRAQALETSSSDRGSTSLRSKPTAVLTADGENCCPICKNVKHPLVRTV